MVRYCTIYIRQLNDSLECAFINIDVSGGQGFEHKLEVSGFRFLFSH